MNKVGISTGIVVRSSSSIPQLCGRKRVFDSMRRRPSRKSPSLSRINVGTIESTDKILAQKYLSCPSCYATQSLSSCLCWRVPNLVPDKQDAAKLKVKVVHIIGQ